MNNGSIITGSSVSSTAEYRGGRVSSFEDKLSGPERFDSLIDLLGGRNEEPPKADQSRTESSDQTLSREVEREEKRTDDDADAIRNDSTTQDLNESAQNQQHPAVNEKSKEQTEKQEDNKQAAVKSTEGKTEKKEEQAPKLSSSITMRQHKSKTTVEGDADKKPKIAAEPVKEKKLQSADAEKKVVVTKESLVPVKSLKVVTDQSADLADKSDVKKGLGAKADSNAAKAVAVKAQTSELKTNAASGKSTDVQAKMMAQAKPDAGSIENPEIAKGNKAPKATATHPVKTTYATPDVNEALRAAETKNGVKPASAPEESLLKTLEREIGIKGAIHSADKQMAILAKEKAVEDKGSDKGFLRDSTEPASGNRAQTVTSRSDMNAFHNHTQSGGQDQSSGGREQFRQWITEAGEIRNTAQSAQQSQSVDRGTVSHLSVHVLNQIMNHIERLRESDKNRVRVSLGMGEHGGISVDIRLEDGSISTSFQGDEDVLSELKRDWRDISEKASRKGVVLNDPEFISYSSSVESSNSLPDSDIEKEEKSQSVIQHKDNQPMRPGLETAAAGSSSPVHSYA